VKKIKKEKKLSTQNEVHAPDRILVQGRNFSRQRGGRACRGSYIGIRAFYH
jgi:hypothetical protein